MCFISNAAEDETHEMEKNGKQKNIYEKKIEAAWIGMRKRERRKKSFFIIVLDLIQKMSKIEFLADYLKQ